MAPPDLSSLSAQTTPRTTSVSNNAAPDQVNTRQSRRTSSVMGPPPLPNNSSVPNSPGPSTAGMADPAATSQGPIRHPKPLTAAELHLELEKEQESIVNRLTRELSALRAQTASVASTASSTSDLFTTSQTAAEYPYVPASSSYGGASIIPTSERRHRSSSNLSTRSARSARETLARDASTTSISGVAAPRDSDRSHQTSARQSLDIQRERPDNSRQNSYNLGLSTGGSMSNVYRSTSNATSPFGPPPGYGYPHPHGSYTSASHTRDPSQQGMGAPLAIGRERSPSFSSATAAARYEEAAVQRQELESVRKENEALKHRIRDLERQLTTSTETTVAT